MPNHDYYCDCCGNIEERFVALNELDIIPQVCMKDACGGIMERQFPFEAARGIQIEEGYYDEALGVNIHGKRHKQQVLRAMGLMEVGDRVGGARDYDAKAPHRLEKQQMRDFQPTDPYSAPDDGEIFVQDKHGHVEPVEAEKTYLSKSDRLLQVKAPDEEKLKKGAQAFQDDIGMKPGE